MILAEYRRADWRPDYSRVLAWTNKRVLGYNQAIREQVRGTSRFHPGDYAICNHYLRAGGYTIKTDQQVRITNMSPTRDGETNVPGWQVTLNDRCSAFLPEIPEHRQQGEKLARKAKNWALLKHIDENWIDLRDPYACTVNKAQGATYDRVFIDLDDIKQCRSNNQLARMLYVAVSRAREQVVFTGDLV
jgi:hypothetical protein